MDWTDEELEELANLSVQFSGIASVYDEIEIKEREYLKER